MRSRTTVTTVREALTALRIEAQEFGYDKFEATAGDVADRIQGFDPYGRPLKAPKELFRKVRNELARMERSGKIWARVTKGKEHYRFGGRRKITVRRKWYSTLVKNTTA
jgi:hypothetical protein